MSQIDRKGTLVVAGAGPLVGLSIAKHFGKKGFRVALISRRKEKLDALVEQLTAAGVEARAFPADLTNPQQLSKAFSDIRLAFGTVDVLEFSPTDWGKGSKEKNGKAVALTAETAQDDLNLLVKGAISCVQQVLPDMLEKKNGALLFTTGYSAIKPLSFIASLGIANSGLRNYAYCLHEDLASSGVYVGTVSINAFIAHGTDGDPGKVAELYYDMYEHRDRIEAVFGPTDH
ncbi:SDR family NAD(P)-dependent oxidoreductase [Paraburkholderia sacchari]|uniref:SDR family NAD(P)-dependent oxidoreductase n=1 Tax=Paraburkholderia sacchari TaxID=159450 RepID=UPI000543CE39|nr:SDR family NAD(P)-dependent oxidoreductase [Paraburkholderia sacchari]NLP64848.1 SDR family NAD(P)-dependent oxidoreductase [Paraburkholderia sacchari]